MGPIVTALVTGISVMIGSHARLLALITRRSRCGSIQCNEQQLPTPIFRFQVQGVDVPSKRGVWSQLAVQGVRYHESAGVVYSSVSYCNEYATMHVLSAEGARQVQIKTGRHAVLHDRVINSILEAVGN